MVFALVYEVNVSMTPLPLGGKLTSSIHSRGASAVAHAEYHLVDSTLLRRGQCLVEFLEQLRALLCRQRFPVREYRLIALGVGHVLALVVLVLENAPPLAGEVGDCLGQFDGLIAKLLAVRVF